MMDSFRKEVDRYIEREQLDREEEYECYNCGAVIKMEWDEFTKIKVFPVKCQNCGRCLECD